MTSWRIVQGDAVEQLRGLPAGSVQTCITSPPFYGLRDYNAEGQLGLEPTPDEYVARLVDVFREVRRVLRDDGTVWLNLGDSYMARQFGWGNADDRSWAAYHREAGDERPKAERSGHPMEGSHAMARATGLKPKDLIGIPWRVAFALQADGWWLRSDIVWAKSNPMPESVTDRPTRAHEYVFLLSKQARYFWDADSIRELSFAPAGSAGDWNGNRDLGVPGDTRFRKPNLGGSIDGARNKRSVWTVATQPFPGAHFAVFPPKLIEPCVLAGSREGDTVLDPFAGAGTTGVVALRHDRSFVGIELNPEYVQMARHRILDDAPLFNTPAEVAA